MRSTRTGVAVGLALMALCSGALAVPASATSPATTKNKERKQNKKIGTASAQAKQAAAAIPVLAAQLGTVNASAVQIVTDLGSPKQLANNVNFLIAAAGALANDVNALKSVDTKHDTQIAQLQKQTILATQLAVGGTNQNSCFGESPSLPSSRNAQVLSLTCLIATNGAVTLPASCRSNKSNGGDCLHARVLSYDAETNPGGVVSDAVAGQDKTLTQRNALTSSDPTGFAQQLLSSDANPTDLLAGVNVQPIAGATSANPVIVHLSILAFDSNPDTSGNAPVTP
jgi:hypothetical protein